MSDLQKRYDGLLRKALAATKCYLLGKDYDEADRLAQTIGPLSDRQRTEMRKLLGKATKGAEIMCEAFSGARTGHAYYSSYYGGYDRIEERYATLDLGELLKGTKVGDILSAGYGSSRQIKKAIERAKDLPSRILENMSAAQREELENLFSERAYEIKRDKIEARAFAKAEEEEQQELERERRDKQRRLLEEQRRIEEELSRWEDCPYVADLFALMDRAESNYLKHPKIVVFDQFYVSLDAQSYAKTPQQIVREEPAAATAPLQRQISFWREGTGERLAYLMRSKELLITQECKPGMAEKIRAFIGDPIRIVREAGRTKGNCCFCSLPLVDERSTAVGYGSTCAKNYGLPWGAKVINWTQEELDAAVSEVLKTNNKGLLE